MAKYKIRDLTIDDKIGLCAVAILGRSVAERAFLLTHQVSTKNKASLGVMLSRWLNDDKAKDFIANVKNRTASAIIKDPDHPNDLTTREGIVNQLIEATAQTSGKDSINGLQTLAKLQGFDKPDEKNEEEKRLFVLTWPSHCRTCKLMQMYLEIQKEENNE